MVTPNATKRGRNQVKIDRCAQKPWMSVEIVVFPKFLNEGSTCVIARGSSFCPVFFSRVGGFHKNGNSL